MSAMVIWISYRLPGTDCLLVFVCSVRKWNCKMEFTVWIVNAVQPPVWWW